jgi:Ran GTPase-activating protein (RanGAP) involved in mRNA processing and transport
VSGNPEMPLVHICQALLWNDTLTHLDLTGNVLDRDACRQLAGALVDNTTLATLKLASMNVEEEQFVIFFAPALQANVGLHHLDLSSNKLGARFVESAQLWFILMLIVCETCLRCFYNLTRSRHGVCAG